MSNLAPPKNWFGRQRLAWIQRRVAVFSTVKRRDIVDKFEISMAQASADLQAYLAENPGALTYDLSAKCYRGGKRPRKNYSLENWDEFAV